MYTKSPFTLINKPKPAPFGQCTSPKLPAKEDLDSFTVVRRDERIYGRTLAYPMKKGYAYKFIKRPNGAVMLMEYFSVAHYSLTPPCLKRPDPSIRRKFLIEVAALFGCTIVTLALCLTFHFDARSTIFAVCLAFWLMWLKCGAICLFDLMENFESLKTSFIPCRHSDPEASRKRRPYPHLCKATFYALPIVALGPISLYTFGFIGRRKETDDIVTIEEEVPLDDPTLYGNC